MGPITPPVDPPRRLSDRALPAYRHVPGWSPHPVTHPDGHSYPGRHPEPPPAVLLPPARWREMPDYLFGIDLYNQYFWWEAHEAWEGPWRLADRRGLQGRCLQGLIQVAAAHLKRHVGQRDGQHRLLERGIGYLAGVTDELPPGRRFMGLDLADFIRRTDRYFTGRSDTFPNLLVEL